jgi:hypothetical protein
MEGYLTALPIKNEIGAMHEGSVLDRLLSVRHSGRTALSIYDPAWPISTDLREAIRYDMLVVATHFRLLRYPLKPSEIGRLGTWRGTVLDPHWQAPEESYRYFRPNLYRKNGKRRAWLLVAMPIGNVLMHPEEVKETIGFPVIEGDILQWQDARYDLYAIV